MNGVGGWGMGMESMGARYGRRRWRTIGNFAPSGTRCGVNPVPEQGESSGTGQFIQNGGDHRSLFNYGWCFERGEGVPRDLSEAARYYKVAVDQGFAAGQNNYRACCLELGEGARHGWKRFVDVTGELHGHTKKEFKPLGEWIVDIGGLEDVGSDLISGGSESVRLLRRKGNGKVIVGKFVVADDSGAGEKEFKRELSSLVSLDHPCVVNFAGCTLPCSLTDHRFLIFTEYVLALLLRIRPAFCGLTRQGVRLLLLVLFWG